MPDLILAAIFALVGFLQGIAWEHHRREREECERTERLWQEVQSMLPIGEPDCPQCAQQRDANHVRQVAA